MNRAIVTQGLSARLAKKEPALGELRNLQLFQLYFEFQGGGGRGTGTYLACDHIHRSHARYVSVRHAC